MKGIQIMNATLNMNSTMGEVFSTWVYDSLRAPSLLGDDAGSAARVAESVFEKKGIRVDYSTLESVRNSTAHLSYNEFAGVRDAASECRANETLREIAVYMQNNPSYRVVALPAATS